ncbi:Uncharacterised protein [Mycolicibacterium aichiense]|nr:Uncharacterised protein [Mycolicibacterium aichiense]
MLRRGSGNSQGWHANTQVRRAVRYDLGHYRMVAGKQFGTAIGAFPQT